MSPKGPPAVPSPVTSNSPALSCASSSSSTTVHSPGGRIRQSGWGQEIAESPRTVFGVHGWKTRHTGYIHTSESESSWSSLWAWCICGILCSVKWVWRPPRACHALWLVGKGERAMVSRALRAPGCGLSVCTKTINCGGIMWFRLPMPGTRRHGCLICKLLKYYEYLKCMYECCYLEEYSV